MKKQISIFFPVLAFSALILSACNAPAKATPTATQGVEAIYTAAAQTIEAQAALATATPQPTMTSTATQTPTRAVTATSPVNSLPISPVQGACDNAVYVSDVTIPDNTVVAPGQVFDKTWALMNTGSCAWTTAYSAIFVSGEKMGGSATLLTQAVPSQQQGNVTVKLTAPTTAGTYTGYWRLANSQGSAFGQQVSVVIVVSGSGTVTVTPTAGSSTAATATVTNLPANTATPTTAVVPASTHTPTATESSSP